MSDQDEHEHDEEAAPPAEDESHADFEGSEEADQADAPTEDETQPEASAAIDQKVIDRVFAQLDNEAARHAKRLGEIMDEEAQKLKLCPTCGPVDGMPHLVGFVLDGPLHPEAVARMRTALGLNDETNVKPDPYSHRCATCDGWGVVQTGSHVPNLEVRSCDDCSGQGFVLLNAPKEPAPFVPMNGTETAAPIAPPAALGPEPPEAASLRARGWSVIPPMKFAAT
jgi:hypothetical protein